MSANLKGTNTAVRLLLSHGEKVWILGIVVCAGMLVWSAISRERLDEGQSPENLKSLINRANTHVQDFTWDQAPEKEQLTATTVNAEAMQQIPHEHFPPLDSKFDERVLDPVKLRTDPELLAVRDLEVYGDSGIIAFSNPELEKARQLRQRAEMDKRALDSRGRNRGAELLDDPQIRPNAGKKTKAGPGGVIIESRSRFGRSDSALADTKAESWVTVVAKIPIKEQYLQYRNALASSRNYNQTQDVPYYMGYIVYRSEITQEGEGDWIRLAPVLEETILKQRRQNVSESKVLINGNYLHPLLTYPLPSLMLREWGDTITHSEIPLAADERATSQPTEAVEEVDTAEEEPTEDDGLFGKVRIRRNNNARQPSSNQGPMASGIADDQQAQSYAPPANYPDASSQMVGGSLTSLPAYKWNEQTEFLLFRYIDKTVKPGKQYRYKVQLALFDVNHNVDEGSLDKTVLDRRSSLKGEKLKWRLGPESAPSPIASVPMLARAFISKTKPAREDNYYAEPELQVLLKTYDGAEAIEAAKLESVERGRVLNTHDTANVIWTESDSDEVKTDFDFFTGITLIDVLGGENMHRKNRDFLVPSQALMMDASGQLYVQSQMDDTNAVEDYQDTVDRKKNARNLGPANNEGLPGGIPGGASRRPRR